MRRLALRESTRKEAEPEGGVEVVGIVRATGAACAYPERRWAGGRRARRLRRRRLVHPVIGRVPAAEKLIRQRRSGSKWHDFFAPGPCP